MIPPSSWTTLPFWQKKVTPFCPVWFDQEGITGRGFMVDFKAEEARFVCIEPTGKMPLETGKVATVTVWTPFGVSSCRGFINWSNREDGDLKWGVTLSDLNTDLDDPIRQLLGDKKVTAS